MPWQLAPNFIRGSHQGWGMGLGSLAHGFEPSKPLALGLLLCLGLVLVLPTIRSSVDASALANLASEEPQVVSADHAYSPETDDLVAMACRRNHKGDVGSDLNRCREAAPE